MVVSLARQRRDLTTQHIKSHTQHPWNELADTLAAGLQSDVPAFESVLPLDDVGVPDLEALEHMAQLEANADGSLPPLSEGGLWLHQPDRPAVPALLSLSHRPGSAGTGQEVAVGLTLGQANALSLGTVEAQEAHGLLEPGRVR